MSAIDLVYENGRITIMFCSFGMSPRIMRFFCTGRVVEWDEPEFEPLLKKMGKRRVEGARAVILLDIFKVRLLINKQQKLHRSPHRKPLILILFNHTLQVQTSCGYGVPYLSTTPVPNEPDVPEARKPELKDRDTMYRWASKQLEKNELRNYQAEWNSQSLDGLPGLRVARRDRKENIWITDALTVGRRIVLQREALVAGMLLGVFTVLALQWIEVLLLGRRSGGFIARFHLA